MFKKNKSEKSEKTENNKIINEKGSPSDDSSKNLKNSDDFFIDESKMVEVEIMLNKEDLDILKKSSKK